MDSLLLLFSIGNLDAELLRFNPMPPLQQVVNHPLTKGQRGLIRRELFRCASISYILDVKMSNVKMSKCQKSKYQKSKYQNVKSQNDKCQNVKMLRYPQINQDLPISTKMLIKLSNISNVMCFRVCRLS